MSTAHNGSGRSDAMGAVATIRELIENLVHGLPITEMRGAYRHNDQAADRERRNGNAMSSCFCTWPLGLATMTPLPHTTHRRRIASRACDRPRGRYGKVKATERHAGPGRRG
jgi:hypothetical protein